MKSVSRALFDRNVLVQNDLWIVASRYQKMRDARWMFAFAHFRITQQINISISCRADITSYGGREHHPVFSGEHVVQGKGAALI